MLELICGRYINGLVAMQMSSDSWRSHYTLLTRASGKGISYCCLYGVSGRGNWSVSLRNVSDWATKPMLQVSKINDTEKAEDEKTAIAANGFQTLPVLHILRAKESRR